ncbi:MAG: DUF945 family protein [Granulosicoccus sp.]
MKKLIIALPFVVGAAAVAGTSQYASSQTKSEYHQLLAQLNDLSPLVFVNEKYESGMTSSSAVTKVLASRTVDAEVLFRLQHDIQHAPVRMADEGFSVGTVSIDTRLHDDDMRSPDVMAMFTDKTPFSLKTNVKYSGEISNVLNVSGIDVTDNGETTTWSGMSFNGVTKDGATVGKGSMGSLAINDQQSGGMLSVEGIPFVIDVQHHGDGVYTGTGDMRFNKVSVLNPQMPMPVSISSVELTSSTDMNGDMLNSSTKFSLKDIESSLPLNNVSLNTQMNGIVVEGVREYNRVTMKALSNNLDTMIGNPDILPDISNGILAMFAPGSATKMTLALDNSEGDVNADIRLAVKDVTADGMSADSMKNIVNGRDLLNILTLDGSLNADTSALAQTPVMMMLGGAGEFISVTDESVTSNLSLNGTTLVVNGVELPLEMMFGFMLDVPFSELASM